MNNSPARHRSRLVKKETIVLHAASCVDGGVCEVFCCCMRRDERLMRGL
jgi:hypothetical protein